MNYPTVYVIAAFVVRDVCAKSVPLMTECIMVLIPCTGVRI